MINSSEFDTFFLSLLTPQVQGQVFSDLVKQGKFKEAHKIYDKLDLTHTDLIKSLIQESFNYLNNQDFDPALLQKINQLILQRGKDALIKEIEEQGCIEYLDELYIHQDNIFPFFNLVQYVPEKEVVNFYDLIIEQMPSHVYIEFDDTHQAIFKAFTDLSYNQKIKLIAQSNVFSYINFSLTDFKEMDDNWDSFTVYSDNHNYVQSEYSQVATLLHALFYVNRPDFKAFFSHFTLHTDEIMELMLEGLSQNSLFNLEHDKFEIFLNQFNLNLPQILNTQFKHLTSTRRGVDFYEFFKNLETLQSHYSLFEAHKNEINMFSNTKFLLSCFSSMYLFFELGNGSEHLIEFLTFTDYHKKGDKVAIMKSLYKNLGTKESYSKYNPYDTGQAFDNYLIHLEKEILSFDIQNDTVGKKLKI